MLEVDCRMELHYSQTESLRISFEELFYYRIKLHYSQTYT